MIAVGAVVAYYSISRYLASQSPSSSSLARTTQWAGYMVASNLQNRQPVVSSISASWTVPEVRASENDTESAAWIGIGGYGDKTLIQTGTDQQCVNGRASYFAWYELIPDHVVRILNMRIRPGDTITASINLIDKAANTWLIEINDVTWGASFKETFFYNSSRLSAEWIIERPTVNGNISTLADFGSVTFSDCIATIENSTGTVSSFPHNQLVMYTSQDVQLVTVSPLYSDGSGFTVNYSGSQVAVNQDTLSSKAVFSEKFLGRLVLG
jgi:hypothetical protein